MRTRSVFEVRDTDGNVVSRGNAHEIADKYYFSVSAVYSAATRRNALMDRQYTVTRVGSEEMVDEINQKIIGYWNSGLSRAQIADRLRMPVQNVRDRIWRMKQRGVIA